MTPEEAIDYCQGWDDFHLGWDKKESPSQAYLRGVAGAKTLIEARKLAWTAKLEKWQKD